MLTIPRKICSITHHCLRLLPFGSCPESFHSEIRPNRCLATMTMLWRIDTIDKTIFQHHSLLDYVYVASVAAFVYGLALIIYRSTHQYCLGAWDLGTLVD